MKISIPEKIKSDIDIIETVWLETANANAGEQSPAFASSLISLKHVAAVNFVEIHNNIFENCAKIQYRILYKNSTTEILKFSSKQQAVYKSKMTAAAQLCVRHKTSELFKDTDEDRQQCLNEIDVKIADALSLHTSTTSKRNLIYYTIYFNKGYVELLNKSIMSILNNSNINFDLLLITDVSTRELILNQTFINKIRPKFLLTDTPFDGVEASQYKTRVFEYEHIYDYDKVLFLDCDIICLKDVNNILKHDISHDMLYTARNNNLAYWHHKTFHHGFEFLGDSHVREMTAAQQMPFNAGQFMFRVSKRMHNHFDNINWMMKNWSGEYFFEQAFMNYYFCKAYITEGELLNKYMSIVSTTNKTDYSITNDTCLVHFIAPPLDAATKLAFINNFIAEQPSWLSRLIDKLKKLFKKLFHKKNPTVY